MPINKLNPKVAIKGESLLAAVFFQLRNTPMPDSTAIIDMSGAKNILNQGGPTEILAPAIKSAKIGYKVPNKTHTAAMTNMMLLNNKMFPARARCR